MAQRPQLYHENYAKKGQSASAQRDLDRWGRSIFLPGRLLVSGIRGGRFSDFEDVRENFIP